MTYTLMSGLASGSVEHPEHGEFDIAGGELDAPDYETAAALVDHFGHLSWPDGDPEADESDDDADDAAGEPDDAADDGDANDDGGDSDVPDVDEWHDWNEDDWLDLDYEVRADDVRSGAVDAHLDDIESVDRSKHVLDAVEARQDELEG